MFAARLNLKSEKFNMCYEISMAFLALTVLVILIIEFMVPLSDYQLRILAKVDLALLSIFAVDYIVRLKAARNKKAFFKNHIIDLVAIIPLDSFLRIARISGLAETREISHIFKVSRFARITAFGRHFFRKLFRLFKTNGLHYMIAFTGGIIFLGAFGILYFEKPYDTITTFGDALWWSLVTTTTVGYGDLSPVTAGGRILAAFLMLTGIGFLGMVTGSVATFFLNQVNTGTKVKRTSVADEEIDFVKKKLDDINDLSRDDILTLTTIIMGVWEQKHPSGQFKA